MSATLHRVTIGLSGNSNDFLTIFYKEKAMLIIEKSIDGKLATAPEKGNVQTFLERLLVEVISENYRHFLNERLIRDNPGKCWPPLFSNEQQFSSFFATGLSRFCPVSWAEDSTERQPNEGSDTKKNGHIDFVATYYENRVIALELKQRYISIQGSRMKKLEDRWALVKEQAEDALIYMKKKENVSVYRNPISVGLLVIQTYEKARGDIDEAARKEELDSVVSSVGELTEADFLAYYDPPREMQTCYEYDYPRIIFCGVVCQRRRQQT
jgi:hypothetical protein